MNLQFMRYIILVFVAFYFVSCDNELDLVANKKETPVVYGLIDQGDTAQYVRVERIFVDEEISGNVIAQNADSLYYDNITVKLIRLNNGKEYTLHRVDGNLEGYQREEGVFATAPNFLYKILTDSIQLIPEELIELNIEGIFEDKVVTSTATVLSPPFLTFPMDGGPLTFDPGKKVNIGWTPVGEAEIYSFSFFFDITENKLGVTTKKRLEWIVASATEKNTVEADGRDFYSFLVGALEEDESINRSFDSASLKLISGNTAIQDYIRVARANLGITSSGEIPVLSNISDGLGVFGTTHTHRRVDLFLSQTSRDSLINGSITGGLNFQ